MLCLDDEDAVVQGVPSEKIETVIHIQFVHCGKYWDDPSCATEEEKEKFWEKAEPNLLFMHKYVDF